MTNKVISKDKYVVTKVLRDIPEKEKIHYFGRKDLRLDRMSLPSRVALEC